MRLLAQLSVACYRVNSRGVLIATLIIFFAFTALVLPSVSQQTKEITGVSETPDTSFLYSPADLYRLAEVYGNDGRVYYIRSRFSFDIVWPLVYLAFLTASLTATFQDRKSLVNVLPFFAVLFDLLENTATSLVMARFPLETPVIDQLAPVFTLVKWVIIGLCFLALVVGLALRVIQWKLAKLT